MRVLTKADGTCPSCHVQIDEGVGPHIDPKTLEALHKSFVVGPTQNDDSPQKAKTAWWSKTRLFTWLSILLVIIQLSTFSRGAVSWNNFSLYLIPLLGAGLSIGGILAVVKSIKSAGFHKPLEILGGLFFVVVGLVFVVPLFQSPKQQEFLDLAPNSITKLDIYSPENISKPLVEIDKRELLSEWATILGTCQYHWLNHPNYEKSYNIELSYGNNLLRYRLEIDSREPDTVDLEPYEVGAFLGRPLESVYGAYKCDGLYDYLKRVLP